MSACHICKRTGIRTCDATEAEFMCSICGFCRAEKDRKEREDIAKEAFK